MFNKHIMNAQKDRITKAASLNTELARWAETQAKSENRSFSNFVETLLQKARENAKTTTTQQEAMAA